MLNDVSSSLLISVVICTYNRAEWLRTALASVCAQSLSTHEYEVIVVDNHSTDTTASVAASFAAQYPFVRYCQEKTIGLSHARNRGWRDARGRYVAYTDDDCKLPTDWLTIAKEIIETHAPGMFGGPYYPFYNQPKPAWFRDGYAQDYRGEQARVITDSYLPGGNLFIQRELLALTRGFDPDFGVKGKARGYGEECEIFHQIRSCRPNVITYYDPRLFVYHLVRPERMTVWSQMKRRLSSGQYYQRFVHRSQPNAPYRRSSRALARLLRRIVFYHPQQIWRRDRTCYPYYQQYLCEEVGSDLWKLGRLIE